MLTFCEAAVGASDAEPGARANQDQSHEVTASAEAVDAGPELGVRVGYASAFGKIRNGHRIRAEVAGALPLWLDVGYRFNRRWFAGGYAQYGLAFQGASSESRCPDCQYSWIRAGLQAQYRFVERPTYNLWVGLGVGREFLNVAIDDLEQSARSTTGWEFANLQFGSELQPTAGLGVGPYFSFALGAYDEETTTCLDSDLCPIDERRVERGLPETGVHGWVSAGIRLVLLP